MAIKGQALRDSGENLEEDGIEKLLAFSSSIQGLSF
jgi:hypothetical protein